MEEMDRLVGVMARLREPGGCPWDREQTLETLSPYLLEEAHEVSEAVAIGEPAKLAEELGDLGPSQERKSSGNGGGGIRTIGTAWFLLEKGRRLALQESLFVDMSRLVTSLDDAHNLPLPDDHGHRVDC